MSGSQWPGLVTNASPFAIPPTAAVEQVNLVGHVPGQVSVRGGMRKVATVQRTSSLLDCFPLEVNGKPALVGMKFDGTLLVMDSPAYGWMSRGPYEPTLSAPQAVTSTSYTWRYTDGSVDDYVPPPPDLDVGGGSDGALAGSLDGGAAITSHTVFVDPSNTCDANGELVVDGGTAVTVEWDEFYADVACQEDVGPEPPSPPPPEPPVDPPPPPTDALSAPRNLTAAFGDESALLDWDAPEIGTPTYYIVQVSLDGGATWASSPAAPTGVQAAFGDESATLTWVAPSANNAAITGYVVEYQDGDDNWTEID